MESSRVPPPRLPPAQARPLLRAVVPKDGSHGSGSKRRFTCIFFVRAAGANRRNRAKLYFHTGKALPRTCRLSLVYMVLAHPKSSLLENKGGFVPPCSAMLKIDLA